MDEHWRRERFGAGQGHPTGWTLEQLRDGWDSVNWLHVADCCLSDLVTELLAERRAHDETRAALEQAEAELRANIAKADR